MEHRNWPMDRCGPGLRAVASGVSVALGKTKQKAPLHEVAHGTHSWSRVGSKVRLMYSPTSQAERRGVQASCASEALRLRALAELNEPVAAAIYITCRGLAEG
jgi:hypothetical protein